MRRFEVSVPARGALVIVGIALCLLGPTRIDSADAVQGATDRALTTSAAAVTPVAHAVVERSRTSTLAESYKFISGGQTFVLTSALIVAFVLVADRDRVVLAMVGVPWRRRGPPTQRA